MGGLAQGTRAPGGGGRHRGTRRGGGGGWHRGTRAWGGGGVAQGDEGVGVGGLARALCPCCRILGTQTLFCPHTPPPPWSRPHQMTGLEDASTTLSDSDRKQQQRCCGTVRVPDGQTIRCFNQHK